MTKEKRFNKNCEWEVREWIKFNGGSAQCKSWFLSIPDENRRRFLRMSWDDGEQPYVSWNNHSFQYFLNKIGLVKQNPKREEAVSMESVHDSSLDFLFE